MNYKKLENRKRNQRKMVNNPSYFYVKNKIIGGLIYEFNKIRINFWRIN